MFHLSSSCCSRHFDAWTVNPALVLILAGSRQPFRLPRLRNLPAGFPHMASIEEMREAVAAAAEHDLTYLLGEKLVPLEVQHALMKAGVTTSDIFGALEEDRNSLKKTLAELLGINLAAGVAGKVQMAGLVAAWEASRKHAEIDMNQKAQAAASGSALPIPVSDKDYTLMESAFIKINGKVEEAERPGQPLMSKRMKEILSNSPEAEALSDIASKADGQEEVLVAEHDVAGVFTAGIRDIKKVKLPADTEELRERYVVLDNSWLYSKLKHSNKPWLQDMHQGAFAKTIKHLLGEKVMKRRGLVDAGIQIPWEAVLTY